MGIIQDILEKDTDGAVKRHLFRTITVGSYALLIVSLLLVGGLVWRVVDGSDVEIFGLKVSGASKDSGGSRGSRTPTRDREPAPPKPPEADKPAPVVPVATATPAARPITINTAWQPLPQGDQQSCLQDAREVFSLVRLMDMTTSAASVWANQRTDGQLTSQAGVRCMDLNGMAVAFMTTYGHSDKDNGALLDKLMQEFAIKAKGATINTLGGGGRQIIMNSGWVTLKDPEIEKCRTNAKEILVGLKASNIVGTGTNFVFGALDSSRISLICTPVGEQVSAVINVAGFNDGEGRRIRDQINTAYGPFRR